MLFLMGIIPLLFFVGMNETESNQGLGLLLLMIVMFFVGAFGNWILMLINSVQHSRVGWVLAIVFLSPLACWIYFLLVYVPQSGHFIRRIDSQ